MREQAADAILMPTKECHAMKLVVFFDQPEQGAVTRVGGKGSNLITLSAAGFLVPPGDEDALVYAIAAARRLNRVTVREQALSRFAISACVDRYESVLGSIATQTR